MARKPRRQIVTPIGTANFPYLRTADTEGQYADDKWKVLITWDEAEADALKAIEQAAREVAEEAFPDHDPAELKLPFKTPEEQTRDENEGLYSMLTKTSYAPDLVDAKKNILPTNVEIQGSDVIRCVCMLIPYESTERIKVGKKTETVTIYGVSAQLQLVQLIEKRAGKSALGALDDIEGYTANDDGPNTTALDDDEY